MEHSTPELQSKMIEHFTSDDGLYFCLDMIKAFKLNIDKFADLQLINRSRHPLIDMAFSDGSDAKKVPLNVLLDLIK